MTSLQRLQWRHYNVIGYESSAIYHHYVSVRYKRSEWVINESCKWFTTNIGDKSFKRVASIWDQSWFLFGNLFLDFGFYILLERVWLYLFSLGHYMYNVFSWKFIRVGGLRLGRRLKSNRLENNFDALKSLSCDYILWVQKSHDIVCFT